MKVRHALLPLLPFAVLGVAACTAGSGTPSAMSAETAAPSPTAALPSTTATAATTQSPTETAAPTTTAPAVPEPEPTLDPVPPVSSTVPPVIMPQPQVCVEPTLADEPVEFIATDWGVTYHGATVPECMRIPESFALRIVNNAEGDLTVGLGANPGVVLAGETVTSAPIGEIFFVGDEFELSFIELGVSTTIEVVPMP